MSLSLIITIACLAYAGLTILWDVFVRKNGRSTARLVGVGLSAAGAYSFVLAFKEALLDPSMIDTLEVSLEENGVDVSSYLAMLDSDTLREALLGFGGAILLPILFVLVFFVLCFVTWILHLIVGIFVKKTKESFSFIGLIAAVVQSVIVIAVWLTPVAFYTDILPDVCDAVVESGSADESTVSTLETVSDSCTEAKESFVLKYYNQFIGEKLVSLTTDIELSDGTEIDVKAELTTTAKIGINVMKLTGKDLAEWTEEEGKVLDAIADDLDGSEFIPTLIGEAIGMVTDKWNNGEDFLGIEKPSLDSEGTVLLDPFMDKLLQVLGEDSKDVDKTKADIKTIAELISLLAREEVLANVSGENADTNSLLDTLGGTGEEGEDSVVKQMTDILSKNSTMKVLVSEITQIGLRAIANTLNLPDDIDAVYGEYMDDVASALNDVLAMSEEQRKTELTSKLGDAFLTAGVDIDESLIDGYAEDMLFQFADAEDEITADDVKDYFNSFTTADAKEEQEEASAKNNIALLGNWKQKERPADLQNKLDGMKDEMAKVNEGMSNPEKMKEISTVVTKDDILTTASAVGLTEEEMMKEITAIDTIFKQATAILDNLNAEEGGDIKELAGAMGEIMNALQETATVGSEKTGSLFVAMLQSDIVADATGMDKKDLGDMARAVTETKDGETVDYAKTFTTVADKKDKFSGDINADTFGDLLEGMDATIARMISAFITREKLIEFGVPETQQVGNQFLIDVLYRFTKNTFDAVAEETTQEEIDNDAEALSKMFALGMDASKNGVDGKKIFKDDKNDESDTLLPTIDETIDLLMKSNAMAKSVAVEVKDTVDPFGLGERLDSYKSTITSVIKDYNRTHTVEDQSAQKTKLENYARLFGIASIDWN